MNYRTPGVFVEEITTLPPSVVSVATAIPAFIGYTEKRPDDSEAAIRIDSMVVFEQLFGGAFPETFSPIEVALGSDDNSFQLTTPPVDPGRPTFWMYYYLQLYFANGGGPCYIISVNTFTGATQGINADDLINTGLASLRKENEPTLIVFPDIAGLPVTNDGERASYYGVYQQALQQCADLKDRFTIIDLHRGDADLSLPAGNTLIREFRGGIGNNNLNYGAAYYPWFRTTLGYSYDESQVPISGTGLMEGNETVLKYETTPQAALADLPDVDFGNLSKKDYYEQRSLFHQNNGAHAAIKNRLDSFRLSLPPSGAIAGIYAQVDNARGVFKAPANVSLNRVVRPLVDISDAEQENLNEDTTGKAVNAIRFFSGRGLLVWGARTLDGNSNEWRYISVRRFFLFAEESIKNTIETFLFEPNNADTWVRIRALIENFLNQQWRAGALAGTTPEQAFFVEAGLPQTMTAENILNGELIVEVGMAVVRPAEFIILRFTHKLQEA